MNGEKKKGDQIMTVKSTVNLNRSYKEQLELLVKNNQVASITEGINCALAMYLKHVKKVAFEQKMKEAANDQEFIERTMTVQREFEQIEFDAEACGMDEW